MKSKLSITLLFLATLFMLSSCDYFNKMMGRSEENPDSMENFFNTLDAYPVFDDCQGLEPEALKDCFESTIVDHIQRDIDTMSIADTVKVLKTAVFVYVDVLKDGSCSVYEIQDLYKIDEQLPNLESLISQSVYNLPQATPAKKKDMFVESRFLIPLTIEGR